MICVAGVAAVGLLTIPFEIVPYGQRPELNWPGGRHVVKVSGGGPNGLSQCALPPDDCRDGPRG
jgi:hypothetical protein